MIKRLADWLEKMSVAAFAIGLFQGHDGAVAFGAGAFSASMALSWLLEREAK